MDFAFEYSVSEGTRAKVLDFYDALDQVTIEQFPGWETVTRDQNKICYFQARDGNKILCYARIVERHWKIFKTAQIPFGPLFEDPDVLIDSIREIHRYYRTRGFCALSVQLAIPTGPTADYIEYQLNRDLKIHYRFDRDNWSSLIVDLSPTPEEILKSFSKGHKSAITKSLKEGLTIDKAQTLGDALALADLYLKMNRVRNLPTDEGKARSLFESTFLFLRETNRGFFLIARDKDARIVGGIVAVFQGDTVRYYKGASDPDRRELAVLHPTLFEAMKLAKTIGFKFFDLWGYNHFVSEDDQIFYINKFKKGFTNHYSFYPKVMYFSLRPVTYFLYKQLLKLKPRLMPLYVRFRRNPK